VPTCFVFVLLDSSAQTHIRGTRQRANIDTPKGELMSKRLALGNGDQACLLTYDDVWRNTNALRDAVTPPRG
jgi:hypothetical protein